MIYCFDIDGVLADKTTIQKLDCTKEADRLQFEKAVPGLPARESFIYLVNLIGSTRKEFVGLKVFNLVSGIFFLTSREETLREKTNKWLFDNGVYVNYDLFMRPTGNNDTCPKLKVAMLKALIREYPGQKIMFFDDNPITCFAVKKQLEKYGVSICEVL